MHSSISLLQVIFVPLLNSDNVIINTYDNVCIKIIMVFVWYYYYALLGCETTVSDDQLEDKKLHYQK